MRAVVLRTHGGPEVLGLEVVPDPIPGPDEVRVRIHSTALNRADVLQRLGGYADPRPHVTVEIPGLEYAGVVESIGERVTRWKPGDRVMAIESGGAYAELICTHERQLMPVPAGVDLADAAAIPEVFLTAWDALVRQGGLTAGRWALVHAGASGVGTAAIQIARAIGARIAVTCSAPKMDLCRSLGADLVVERSPHDWVTTVRDRVPQGFDVVLDVVGGEEVERNLHVARTQGTIVQVGLLGGATTSVNVGLLLMKRLTWVGTTLRARPLEEKIAVTQQFIDEMLPLFDSGVLRPVIDSRYRLEDIAEAHRSMGDNRNSGKILVDISAS